MTERRSGSAADHPQFGSGRKERLLSLLSPVKPPLGRWSGPRARTESALAGTARGAGAGRSGTQPRAQARASPSEPRWSEWNAPGLGGGHDPP